MNSAQHDELAQLFQNMQFSHPAAAFQQQQQQPIQPPQIPETPDKKNEAMIHYASAHYTPNTAHVRAESEPSRSPPPPYREAVMPEAMAETLRQHSIDPFALLPNQIDLFLNADYEQRLRLLELWRIAPPSYPLDQHLQGQWSATNMEKEENEARLRYEQQMQVRSVPQEEHMLDTVIVGPISPIRQEGEPAWPPAARMRAASIAAGQGPLRQTEAEPYIVNGYEIAAASPRAVEPVYAAAGLWQAPSYAETMHQEQQHQRALEDQYGMYEQIRNHADWERMNEQMMREKFVGQQSMDDEMVM
ncbi:hypothetical protein M409DRAFT_23162 [Zasmidium cellare ATCC 36951]|uniref:Uncharacterized protein n=1 Tax=Zasmidium cellare ATCC 36951 TaxID=1080233 RepID=A0A6A6CH48_ZASCE|nr:uncharacterized protein M409DRAFT_23162 [Zasmidium cellare ATCC 36951]KAF2166524.1 hypothetical protein M409DRAFT_23162 [Zasmidium cellare ATCC 36951]